MKKLTLIVVFMLALMFVFSQDQSSDTATKIVVTINDVDKIMYELSSKMVTINPESKFSYIEVVDKDMKPIMVIDKKNYNYYINLNVMDKSDYLMDIIYGKKSNKKSKGD